jgi:hypothetical protein
MRQAGDTPAYAEEIELSMEQIITLLLHNPGINQRFVIWLTMSNSLGF